MCFQKRKQVGNLSETAVLAGRKSRLGAIFRSIQTGSGCLALWGGENATVCRIFSWSKRWMHLFCRFFLGFETTSLGRVINTMWADEGTFLCTVGDPSKCWGRCLTFLTQPSVWRFMRSKWQWCDFSWSGPWRPNAVETNRNFQNSVAVRRSQQTKRQLWIFCHFYNLGVAQNKRMMCCGSKAMTPVAYLYWALPSCLVSAQLLASNQLPPRFSRFGGMAAAPKFVRKNACKGWGLSEVQ